MILPELWTPSAAYAGLGSFLGHRGWEGEIPDFAAAAVTLADRAGALCDRLQRTDVPSVVIAHGASAGLAVAVAAAFPVAAVVLLGPLLPGSPALRRFVYRPGALWAIGFGRPTPPPPTVPTFPRADEARASREGDPGPRTEPGRLLAALARRGMIAAAPPERRQPCLVVGASDDPLLPRDALEAASVAVGARAEMLSARGHWWPCQGSWSACGAVVHRWLVQTLGEPLLDLHAEAMAERGDDDDA